MKKRLGRQRSGKTRSEKTRPGKKSLGGKRDSPKRSASPAKRSSRPAAKSANRGVFLVGFMGAGKSSVGRALGQRLNWIFEDLDDRIEQIEKQKIAEIFAVKGETHFRQAEQTALRQVLEELQSGVARVIALGGGAFVQKDNAELLLSAGVPTIFLDAPVEELWQRCRHQADEAGTERPLLKSRDSFHVLYQTRRKSYLKARVKIETGSRDVETIAAEIVKKLDLKEIAMRTQRGESE